LDISKKKFGSAYAQSPRKCSNFKILAKIEGKEAKFFFENLPREYKDLILVKKNSKLSHACVPLNRVKFATGEKTTCCYLSAPTGQNCAAYARTFFRRRASTRVY
jgi:hypothetical protein